MKKVEFLSIPLISASFKPDAFRRCNAAAAGSKPGEMQRTAKEKAAGKPEKPNQRHPTKILERMLYIIAKVKQNEKI